MDEASLALASFLEAHPQPPDAALSLFLDGSDAAAAAATAPSAEASKTKAAKSAKKKTKKKKKQAAFRWSLKFVAFFI